MKFRLEVEFEMDMLPKHRGLMEELTFVFVGKREGEVTFSRWAIQRLTERGDQVLGTMGQWESKS